MYFQNILTNKYLTISTNLTISKNLTISNNQWHFWPSGLDMVIIEAVRVKGNIALLAPTV